MSTQDPGFTGHYKAPAPEPLDDDDDPTPEDEYRYRVRRQRRASVTLVLVLVALAAGIYYASTYFRDTTPRPGPCTTEVALPVVRPADVTVNVLNATKRAGLALSTSKAVAQRGFKIAKVGNDTSGKAIAAPAEIRHGAGAEASAALLATHIPGAVLVKDARKDKSVDLVIGNGWKAVGPVPATPTTSRLAPCATVTVAP